MRVECPKCHEARELTAHIPPGGMSYVCPACGHAFHVGEARARAGAKRSRQKLYVRRSSGKVLGPFPTRVIEQMIRSKQLDEHSAVSEDGANFTPIAEHESFAALLGIDYTGKSTRTSGDGNLPSPQSSDPFADLPSPQGASDPFADLPSPQGGEPPAAGGHSDPFGFDDLPASRESFGNQAESWGGDLFSMGGDLPAPQSHNASPAGYEVDDLPAPSFNDLPSPQQAGASTDDWFDLPAPGGNLPAAGGNLPAPGGNLPAAGGNLPAPGGNLPAPGGNLPAAGGNLPAVGGNLPAAGGNLPASGNMRSPGSQTSPGQAFSRSSEGQTSQVRGPGKSPYAQPTKSRMDAYQPRAMGNAKGNSTQMFGSFSLADGNDIPLMDQGELPVIEEPQGHGSDVPLMQNSDIPYMGEESRPGDNDLGMFLMGNDAAGGSSPDPLGLDHDTPAPSGADDPLGLFGGASDNSDPLGLEASHSDPLGLASPPPHPRPAETSAAPKVPPLPPKRESFEPFEEDDSVPLLEPEGDAGPSLAAPNTARSFNYGERDEEEEEEAFELDLEEHEVATEPVGTEASSSTLPSTTSKPKSSAKVYVLAALVVLALGVGFLFSPFGPLGASKESAEEGGGEGGGGAKASASELSTEGLELDSFAAYTEYIKRARSELKSTNSPRARGLLLTGIALALTRYPKDFEPLEREGLELLAAVQKDAESEWKNLGLGAWYAYKGNAEEANKLLMTLATSADFTYFSDLLRGVAAYQQARLTQLSREERLALLEQAITNLERVAQTAGAPSGAFFLGLSLEAQGKPSQAMRAFGDALNLSSDHIGARLELARLKTANGEFDEAKDQYSQVLDSEGASPYEMATAHQIAGQHALSRNDIELAISEFRAALELYEGHAEALRGLGDAYIRGKRYQEGIDFFQQRFGLTPKSAEVQLAIAKGYLALAREALEPSIMYERAGEVLEQGRQMHESDPRFPYHLGMLYEAEERISEAETAYQTAIDVSPGFSMAKIQLARLLSTKGTPEADLQASELVKDVQRSELSAEELTALGQFFINRGEHDGGVQLLKEATERNANWVPAHALLVEYYVSIDDITEATVHLDALRRLNALTPQLRYLNAKAHYARGEYKDAIEVMADVVTEEPENAEYLHFLGLVYFARESYPTARRYFEDAIASESSFWDAHFYIGRCHFEVGENEAALKIFRRIHDEKPTNGEYHYWLAVSVGAQSTPGATSQSLRELNQLLQRAGDPDDKSSMFAVKDPRPHYQRGRLHRMMGNRRKAEADFQKALEIDKDFVDARADLGRVLFESGNMAFAADELEQVRDATEGEMDVELYLLLGLCYLDLKKEEDGVRALEQARDRGLSDLDSLGIIGLRDPADVHRTLGYLYRDRRRNSEAVEEFELYLRKSKTIDPTTRREIQLEISRLR